MEEEYKIDTNFFNRIKNDLVNIQMNNPDAVDPNQFMQIISNASNSELKGKLLNIRERISALGSSAPAITVRSRKNRQRFSNTLKRRRTRK